MIFMQRLRCNMEIKDDIKREPRPVDTGPRALNFLSDSCGYLTINDSKLIGRTKKNGSGSANQHYEGNSIVEDIRLAVLLIYREIKQAIIQSKFLPGGLLPEETLASSLGISRTPLRKATFTGAEVSVEMLLDQARQILRTEMAFNESAGIGVGQNDLPAFFRSEPLPNNGLVFDVPFNDLKEFSFD